MSIVVTLDQRRSRESPDLVEEAVERLGSTFGAGLLLGLARTAGDEMQAVVGESVALPRIVEFCLRSGAWWLGIGVGRIESLGRTSRESRGPAFAAARDAVDHAKHRPRWSVAVRGEPKEFAARLEGMCDVMASVVARRTERQWEVIDAVRRVESGSRAAEVLGITPQGANALLRASGFHEQQAVEREIEFLASSALSRSSHHA